MSREQKRLTVLLAVALVVAGLVAMDRLLPDSGESSQAVSVNTEYLRQAELVAQMQGFINAAPEWLAVDEAATARWRDEKARMIVAPTAALANSRLQQKLTQIVSDLGVTLSATSTPTVRAPVEGEPLRVIGLTISIQAPSPQTLHAFVDRVENMPDVRTNIRRLQTLGPGPRRTPTGELNVELDLEALAWITQEPGDAPRG